MRPFLNINLARFLPKKDCSDLGKKLLAAAQDKQRITRALQENPEIEIKDLIQPIKPETSVIKFVARQLKKPLSVLTQ